jgi:hypothetical protein
MARPAHARLPKGHIFFLRAGWAMRVRYPLEAVPGERDDHLAAAGVACSEIAAELIEAGP